MASKLHGTNRGRGCYDVLHGLDAVRNSLLPGRDGTRHRWHSSIDTQNRKSHPGTGPTHVSNERRATAPSPPKESREHIAGAISAIALDHASMQVKLY